MKQKSSKMSHFRKNFKLIIDYFIIVQLKAQSNEENTFTDANFSHFLINETTRGW